MKMLKNGIFPLFVALCILPAGPPGYAMGKKPATEGVEGQQDPFQEFALPEEAREAVSEAQEEALEKSRPPIGREIAVSEDFLRRENK